MIRKTSPETKGPLTKIELLEIESFCDLFEEQLRAQTRLQPVSLAELDTFLENAHPRIRTRLKAELHCILNDQDWISLSKISTASVTQAAYLAKDSTVSEEGPDALGRTCTGNAGDKHASRMQARVPVRFRLEMVLGSGSSAEVWLAVDTQLHRPVSIKIAHSETISPLGFLREARSNSRLTHTNIVRVLEIASEEDWPYLVCEYVDGESLEKKLAQETPPYDVCVAWLADLSDAIAYAHSEGVVHRDIKPHNVLIDRTGKVHLTDFGIAKDYTDFEATHTQTGHCIGTPAYMSPQQASGQNAASPADDIFALGVVMYKMLTGEVPFRGNTQSVLFQLVHCEPQPIRESHPDVPKELELLCMKCLEKRPADRLPNAAFLRDELNRYLRNEPLVSRPATRVHQLAKWTRRNPRLAQSMAASFSMLAILACSSLLFAWSLRTSWRQERAMRELSQHSELEANQALEREKVALATAQHEGKVSDQVIGFLETLFQSNDPVYALLQESSGGGSPPTLLTVLENAFSRIETDLQGQPQAQSRLLDILGNAYRSIGYSDQAKKCLQMSEEVRTEFRNKPDSGAAIRNISSTDKGLHAYYLGCLVHDQGDLDSALAHYHSSLSILSDVQPEADRTQLAISDVEFQIGRLFFDRRDNATARDWMSRSLEHRRGILAKDSNRVRSAEIAVMLSEVTDVTKWPEQLQSMIGSESSWSNDIVIQFAKLTLARMTLSPDKVRPRFERLVESLENALSARHPFSLLALGDYASWLHDQGEYELAYPVTSRLIEIADTVAPNHPKLRHAKVRFALELTRSTRLEEANRYYQEVLSNASNDLGVTLEAQLGHLWCSLAQGQTSEMAPLISKLIEQSQKRSGHEAAWCAYAVSRGSHCLGDFNNAKQYAAIALERAKACQPIPVNPLWLERLATIHATHDEFERAAELLRTAVDLERSMRPPKHPRLADKLLELGGCLQKQGKFDEAEPMLHEALNIYQIRMPKGDMRIESAKKRMESGAQSMVDRTDLNH